MVICTHKGDGHVDSLGNFPTRQAFAKAIAILFKDPRTRVFSTLLTLLPFLQGGNWKNSANIFLLLPCQVQMFSCRDNEGRRQIPPLLFSLPTSKEYDRRPSFVALNLSRNSYHFIHPAVL